MPQAAVRSLAVAGSGVPCSQQGTLQHPPHLSRGNDMAGQDADFPLLLCAAAQLLSSQPPPLGSTSAAPGLGLPGLSRFHNYCCHERALTFPCLHSNTQSCPTNSSQGMTG